MMGYDVARVSLVAIKCHLLMQVPRVIPSYSTNKACMRSHDFRKIAVGVWDLFPKGFCKIAMPSFDTIWMRVSRAEIARISCFNLPTSVIWSSNITSWDILTSSPVSVILLRIIMCFPDQNSDRFSSEQRTLPGLRRPWDHVGPSLE